MGKLAKHSWLGTTRIAALTDGVFAFAMTLLAVDLKVPLFATDTATLAAGLALILPNFFIFLISFVALGAYWVAQHNASRYVKYADRFSLWINLAFLGTVVLVPFTTSLLARYPTIQLTHFIYAANLILLGLTRLANWRYAVSHNLLSDVNATIVGAVEKRILFGPSVCILAVAVSFINLNASLLLYLLIPLYFIVPSKLDAFWSRD